MGKEKYSDEELLNFLKKYYVENGRVPSSTDITRTDGYPSGATYWDRFGSYDKALKLAELKREKYKRDGYSDEDLKNIYKEVYNYYGFKPTYDEFDEYRKGKNYPSSHTIINRFGSIDKLHEICGFQDGYRIQQGGSGYKEEFLLSELKRFYNENGRLPKTTELDVKNCGYPSRKTYTKYFGSFNEALRKAGFQVEDKPIYNKEYLISEIHRFINEFGRVPYARDMDDTKGYPCKQLYSKHFGTWNNAIKECGFKPRVSQYTDEQLKEAFMSFVNKYNRIPTIQEFNNSEYPSFWCYQNRFGSWNKAVEAYGFVPNDFGTGLCLEFDDGEMATSKYEIDFSNWLRDKGIPYTRNYPYSKYIKEYKGRKDCDYVITYNDELLFIEIAGMYNKSDKASSVERDYTKRFDDKLNILNKHNLNYKVFYPSDFKNKTVDELLSFLIA